MSLERKRSILLRALPLKKQNTEFFPQFVLRSALSTGALKQNYWFCRRYSANFGGFVSLAANNNNEGGDSEFAPIFANGYSFFNRFAGQGWTFFSERDYFPLDLFELNKKFKSLFRGKVGLDGSLLRPALMLTESYNPSQVYLQPRNFARTYRPRFNRDFDWCDSRSGEVFDHFHYQTRIEPHIRARHPAANMRGGAYLVFSKKDFEISSIFFRRRP